MNFDFDLNPFKFYGRKSFAQKCLGIVLAALNVTAIAAPASFAENLTEYPSSNTLELSSDKIFLARGKMFIAPSKSFTLITPEAEIRVAAGAKVLVVKTQSALSVFNLCDHHRNEVTVLSGHQSMALSPGQQVVLTSRKTGRFESINPATTIAFRDVREYALENGLRLFDCAFSIPSALMNVPPLRTLASSSAKADKKLFGELAKTAAILHYMKGKEGPYRTTQVSRIASKKRPLDAPAISTADGFNLTPQNSHNSAPVLN